MNDRLDPLLEIARELRDPASALGGEVRAGLAATSSLSSPGVELALSDHLEVAASAADRASLIAWSRGSQPRLAAPARCHVVLSAHVCTAALRAIALALESAQEVVVRPSRRDPVLATLITRELASRGVPITLSSELSARAGDVVHAYGSDRTLADIARSLPEGVRLRAHGSGIGVALVGGDADLAVAAAELARDVVPFDQRGCLSPRVALTLGSFERGLAFAREVSRALARSATSVPRGVLDGAERAEVSRFRATCEALGEVFEDRDHLVAMVDGPDHLLLPPAARVMLVAPIATTARARDLLEPLRRSLTTLGWSGEEARSCLHNALRPAVSSRIVPLGLMQRPPLDGPVDLRDEPTLSSLLGASAH